jgi:probable HAF family extracellular repeat protein
MTFKTWSSTIALTLFAALVLPSSMTAQKDAVNSQHHHYQLVQIPTLGGPSSHFFDVGNNIAVLNRGGSVTGFADTTTPDPFSPTYWFWSGYVNHAFLWQNGSETDLGALPGTVSSASTWISENGTIAGYSENGQIDPSVPDLPEFSPVVWRNGKIANLGTLPGGGYQGAGVSVNNRGEVAGVATNLVPDANSLAPNNVNLWLGVPYGYQLRAFVWDQKNGMQDLGTLGGTDAEAFEINQHGQVIGDSYTSSNPGFCYGVTSGAFIWDRKHGMVDLGSFGGTCTVPIDMNNQGQVVGVGWVAGDSYNRAFLWEKGSFRDLGGYEGNNTAAYAVNDKGEAVGFAQHAALWKKVGELIDLGTVGNDPCSFAQGINDDEQVVGNSSPSDCVNYDTSRGFLWEHGSIADLNTLIPANSPLNIVYAYTINRRGEIAVNGIDANGIEQAAVLIPCDENHSEVEGCDYSLVDASAATRENAAPPMRQPTTAPRTLRPFGRRGLAFGPRQIGANIPSSTRSLTSTLSVTDSAADTPQIVSLSGTDVHKCTLPGRPCGPVPCCPGLVCKFRGGSTRVGYACEPKGLENTSRSSSFWDRVNANKLE